MHVPAQVNLTVNCFTRSVASVSPQDEPNTGRVEVYGAANRLVKIIAQFKYDIYLWSETCTEQSKQNLVN